jgi:F-type H+-transporting ATPase subunit epsilon
MYHLYILTPEQVFFDDEVISIIVSGEQGYLGVLTNHAPLIISLRAGALVITDKNNKKSYYHASSGFLEVNRNKASIIIETIYPTDPIDIGTQGGI